MLRHLAPACLLFTLAAPLIAVDPTIRALVEVAAPGATGNGNIYAQPDHEGFIIAGVLWEPGRLVYYANGVEVLRWENARVPSVPGMLMFTMPIGGWDNTPLDDSALPADFVIDWVRAWQRKDLAALPPGK